MSEENLICSFCSKSRKDVTKMIVGATKVAICNECVKLCVEILEEDVVKSRKEKLIWCTLIKQWMILINLLTKLMLK